MNHTHFALDLTESGYVPDMVLRRGIKLLLKQRLRTIESSNIELSSFIQQQFIDAMNESTIAPLPHKANEQHYEVPAEFYQWVLGDYRKYSSCYWDAQTVTLSEAEEKSLQLSCDHARLEDGQDVLELGCGWGSLSLFMAKRYPNSRITAVSNSNSQREYINQQIEAENISNLNIITADMNDFRPGQQFDRIVSVEMMEHMRNYQELYRRMAEWLREDGKLFKHIFVHRNTPYPFEVRDETDWMSQYFFSGGMMPSDDLPLWFQQDLKIKNRWRWSGVHYQKTANAWLENMDTNRQHVMPILASTYGAEDAEKWWNRWRMFFMACAELFGYNHGQEWFVSHYLFSKKK